MTPSSSKVPTRLSRRRQKCKCTQVSDSEYYDQIQQTDLLSIAQLNHTVSWIPRIDLFNKIASSCFQKCTSAKHREPDLTLGEMTCTDRCVSKYLECQERIGSVLQKANEAQIAQQQNMNEMQQRMK